MPNVLEMISDQDRLDFAQNYSIERNYVGDRLFPDVKTENLEAEYERLSEGMDLPTAASVHAFDSEAAIGVRPAFERVTTEKLLIKEKINQSERLRLLLNHGVSESNLIGYVFDDMGRLADSVKTRTEIAKMDVMSTGQMAIKENGLDFTIDFGVNKKKTLVGWEDPEHDILGDIADMVQMALDAGYVVNAAMLSTKMRNYMLKNNGINKMANGVNYAGMVVTPVQLDNLLNILHGITLTINDDLYGVASADNKTRTSKRFFPDNVFTLYIAGNGGRIGTGLWGVTPEEDAQGAFTDMSEKQFITISQWATQDPVAEWTKASGVFIPVLPNPYGVVIGTLSTNGQTGLDNLFVTSVAGTKVGDTKITVSPALAEGHSYKYKVADDCTMPAYLGSVKSYPAWDGKADITAASNKEILIVECDEHYRAVKAGIAKVTSKVS